MMGKGRRPWIYRWAIRRHWATVIRFPVMVITSRVSTSQESHVPTVLRACFIACQLLVSMCRSPLRGCPLVASTVEESSGVRDRPSDQVVSELAAISALGRSMRLKATTSFFSALGEEIEADGMTL